MNPIATINQSINYRIPDYIITMHVLKFLQDGQIMAGKTENVNIKIRIAEYIVVFDSNW